MSGSVSFGALGLGCMRLSTDPRRDEERARATLRAAIEAGATLLDTADAYAWSDAERGHNERWVGEVVRECARPVAIATKGGLTRPDGRWVPDGRASHLRAACEASLRALGVDRVDLYQLHAPDPKTPWRTSVRALAKLREDGLARHLGLCNVSVPQLEEALEHAPIDAVQVAFSPFDGLAVRGGIAARCRALGVALIAHSPLGGPRRAGRLAKDRVLGAIAARHGATAAQIALAWLRDLGALPIPGATRPEHAIEAMARIALTDEDRAELDAHLPLGAWLRAPRRPPPPGDRELVLLMGIPGAGKTTHVRGYVERGYARLNRDEQGGTLRQLAQRAGEALAGGARRVVLDNTYATRAARHEVIEAAWNHGVPVRCVWIDTPLEQAQVNAVLRLLDRYGEVPAPGELARLGKKDPNVFDPRAQLRYRRELEPPALDEGFASLERLGFTRALGPPGAASVLFALEAFAGAGGVDPARAARVRECAREGFAAAIAWFPRHDAAAADARIARVHEQLGLALPIAWCGHPAGAPICWCRKPLPGLALALMRAHGLDPRRSRWVGTGAADRALAGALGFAYEDADAFFRGQ